ncbi:MAG: arsenical pump-driving ATPase [Bdellovibrionaceae bacterium]|nr:arsenical pump-driving ATPase [Pseudobdellovibrionaceae bacterium]
MAAEPKNNCKIYLVSGKGGVGKSTVAAAIGHSFASRGLKTLLIELGYNSYFNYVFGRKFSFQPYNIKPNLDLAIWSGEECLKEFISYYIRLSTVVDLFFENKIMKTLVKAAPALQELAILGKLTSGFRKIGPELNYDRIVVDAFSSGHFLSLLRVPKGISDTISLGPMGQQSANIHKTLINSEICNYVWVSTCEELPVQESLEFIGLLNTDFNVTPKLILNKILRPQIPNMVDRASGKFASYLQNIKKREDWSTAEFVKNSKNYVESPFSFHASVEERIQYLSEVYSSYESFV